MVEQFKQLDFKTVQNGLITVDRFIAVKDKMTIHMAALPEDEEKIHEFLSKHSDFRNEEFIKKKLYVILMFKNPIVNLEGVQHRVLLHGARVDLPRQLNSNIEIKDYRAFQHPADKEIFFIPVSLYLISSKLFEPRLLEPTPEERLRLVFKEFNGRQVVSIHDQARRPPDSNPFF